MNIKKLVGTAIVILAFIIGCAGNYGKIRVQKGTENKVTLIDIIDNWDDYDIHYGRRAARYADAIMFDPKNSSTKLSGDSWINIEDQETLDEKIKEIQLMYNNANVYLILGGDNQLFGYMYYSGHFHVGIKIVDERTLYLMPLPPPYSGP